MGRELKRVALDFDWPVGKTWLGYLNPYPRAKDCAHCDGKGYSPEAQHLHDQWYGYAPFKPEDRGSTPLTIHTPAVRAFAERNVKHSPEFYGTDKDAVDREATRLITMWNQQWSKHINTDDVAALVAANRLHDFTHVWSKETGWVKKDPPCVPTPEEVNAWNISSLGHDAINCSVVIRAECERRGVPEYCAHCEGHGSIWPNKATEHVYEAWKQIEPPAGDGYQIWETVSEGSPISPVFATPEELARHMADTRWGADYGTSYETWLSFINGPGWAPSMVLTSAGIVSGVEAVVDT